MDVSITVTDSELTPNVTDSPMISESAPPQESVAPRELVREVAASLSSLAKVLPYGEYAAIVHQIARLRWRCGEGRHSGS